MNFCALNTHPATTFIDHISPLASLMGFPLIISEEKNFLLTKKYYPEVNLHYWPDLEFRFGELAVNFDALIECGNWSPYHRELFRRCFRKEMHLILCPHGQSDKTALGHYRDQECVLIYGSLMKEMLQELNIWNAIPSHVKVGNFRHLYYRNYRDRLFSAAEQEIFSRLNPSNKTLLYAPTWKDHDDSTTLFAYGEKLFRETPSDWNLIIKIHPYLPERHPELFYSFSLLSQQKENIIFVDDFPLIYPILEKIDAYLGDYSSIGYDVLSFRKPMFFLKQPHMPITRLQSCGPILDPSKNLFQSIESGILQAEKYLPIQEELYRHAFEY